MHAVHNFTVLMSSRGSYKCNVECWGTLIARE